MGRESYMGRRGTRSGGGNSCAIMIWSMITFVVCLCLSGSVTNCEWPACLKHPGPSATC